MRKIAFLLFCFISLGIFAQTLSRADDNYVQFKTLLQQGAQSSAMYNYAYNAYVDYAAAIKDMEAANPEYSKIKERLVEIFPVLDNGAYYYTAQKNQPLAIKFAQAYVDLSLLYAVSDQNLTDNQNYKELSFFAGYQSCNQKQYETAIRFFQAYLTANDTDLKRKENAFYCLAYSYLQLKNYDNAKFIASRGLELFPNSWNMIVVGFNACEQSKDDSMKPKFLELGLRIKPDDPNLLKNQALMYEKQKNFAEAANAFKRLDARVPNNLDTYTHIGFNYYNAGVQLKAQADATKQKSEKASYEQLAKNYFTQAATYLKDVLRNSPYAANVAKALAMCYSVTNNTTALEQANQNLMAMKVQTVKMGEVPLLQDNYKPTADISTPVALPEPAKKEIFLSDVDKDIPVASQKNTTTYAVIIGNENYKHHQKVDYANNDAKVFGEYCEKTLGIPKDHIRLVTDASLGEMSEQVDFMVKKAQMNPGELNFIFYYSGHGLPDTNTGLSYLMPADASGTNFNYCYSLDKLYETFQSMDTKGVTVFLDACFSGATGNGQMLFKERYVEYTPKEIAVDKGKMVVFSSCSGNQTSLFYDDEHHGFFTYFLLKNLKESKGTISFDTLAGKLKKQVDNAAYDKKNKNQTPTVKWSSSMGDSWKTMSLIK